MRVLLLLLGLAATAFVSGCEGQNPFARVRDTLSGEAQLFSLARPELVGLPSAFSFIGRFPSAVAVEQRGGIIVGDQLLFDFALTEDSTGLLLAPPDALSPRIMTSAGIAVIPDRGFEEVTEAPAADDAYAEEEPVRLRDDVVYVIRTRRGGACVRFAKIEALEIDFARGSFRFRYLYNPNCSRELVPTEDEEEEAA